MSCRTLLVLAAVALGCGGGAASTDTPPKIGRTQSTHVAPPIDLPAEFGGQQPALSHTAVLGLLPDTTMAAIVARSPAQLAVATEAVTVLREYREFFAEANVALDDKQAAHLLETATWSHLGIDPNGPMGAALLVEKRAIGVFFVTLSDPEVFQQSLTGIAGAVGLGKIHVASIGESQVVHFERANDVALIIKAQAAMLIVPDRSSDLEPVLARLLGNTQAPTLSQTGRVAKIFSDFDYGEDVAGFIAFDTIASKILDEQNDNSGNSYWGEELERLETKVEDAKASGAAENEINELERQLAVVLEQYNRYVMQESAEARFTGDVLRPLGTMAFGVDLGGAKTGVRLRIQASPGSLADRLLVAGAGPLALPKRLQEAPLWLLAAHLNKPAAIEFFTTLLNMDGETPSTLAAELKKEFGVELADVVAALGGELSGAFTVRDSALKTLENVERAFDAFGMHVLIEVRDEAAARRLFNQAAQAPAFKRYVVGQGDTLAIEMPGFNARPIRAQLDGRFLEIRTMPRGAPSPVWREHEKAWVGSASNLALAVLDPMVLQWLLFSTYSDMEGYASGPVAIRADGSKAPVSKQQERLTAINAEIKTLEAQRDAIRTNGVIASSKALGRVVLVARPEAGGLAVVGSLVGSAASLARGIQAVVESFEPEVERMRTGKETEAERLDKKLSKLRSERWQLRDSSY